MTLITSPPRLPAEPSPTAATDRVARHLALSRPGDPARTVVAAVPRPLAKGLIGVAEGAGELLLLYVVGSSVRALVGLG